MGHKMSTTVVDLLALGLDPQEFMTTCYVLTQADGDLARVPTKNIAAVLGCDERTARRVIGRLIEAGILTRIEKEIYRICLDESRTPMTEARTPMTEERSLVTEERYVYSHMASKAMTVLTPIGVNTGGYAPAKGENRRSMPIEYDTGDHLGGVGMTEPRVQPTRQKKDSKPPGMHREVPREQWNMRFVAKEFRHRLHLDCRDKNLYHGGGNDELVKVLKIWEGQHGLTPVIAASIVDDFFADAREVSRISNETPAWRQFLEYLKRNVDRHTNAASLNDYIDSIEYDEEDPF